MGKRLAKIIIHAGLLAAVPAAAAFGQEGKPAPPPPRSAGFDWVQLDNGEWLKGEIEDLQYDEFTFESDELDELTLDFDDVYAVYSDKINTIVFDDKSTVEGRFAIEGDTITVVTDEGEKTYSRRGLRSIIPGKMTEWNFWSGKLSFGTTTRQGNVNQTDVSLLLRLQRHSPGMRLAIDYNGAYGTVEGQKTANNHHVGINNDIYITRELFVRVPTFEAFRDEFQNIAYRLTLGVLIGYDIIDRDGLEWTVSGGGGYQATKFFSAAAGQPGSEQSGVALFSTNFKWEATKKVDVIAQYGLAVPVTGPRNNVMRLVLGTEIDVWKDLDFDLQFILNRQSSPATQADGTVPKENDVQLFIGLGWEF